MELFIYDLIMFRDKKDSSISIEIVNTMKNIRGIYICETDHFRFDECNLKVLQEDFNYLAERYNYLAEWYKFYNYDIEIVGIWRFNKQTKNYEVVYYEN